MHGIFHRKDGEFIAPEDRHARPIQLPVRSGKPPFWTAERSGIFLVLFLLAAAAAAIALLAGCQSGTSGSFRPLDFQVHETITNAVAAAVGTASTVLPFPWSYAFEAAGGAALTLLAAWQAMTHRTASANKKELARLNGDKNK